jgi:hypothetical protein
MAKIDQRIGQVRDDAFGSTIQSRWYGLVQRRDLGNSHLPVLGGRFRQA